MVGISFWLFVLGSVSCTQPPIYQTANGQVRGIIRQSKATNEDVQIFYGIPYAKPPVGDLRFENPVDPDDWTPDVRNATTFHARCHQYNSSQKYVDSRRQNTPGESEDCLYLNIFVPTPAIACASKAVLVYIHGGSNVLGSAHMFDGTELASVGDIIVVTVNYRIGVLGFFGSGEADFPGNYALRDQIKALEWVKDNIANFGGDPDKVTLAGHGSAAWNVGRHLVSPLAAGLFRAVVSISGSPTLKAAFRTVNISDPQSEVQKMAREMNCNITTLKQCLRTKTALELSKEFAFHHEFLPAAVIPDSTFSPIDENAIFNAHHYLISYTTDEGYFFAKRRKVWPTILKYMKQFDLIRSDVDLSVSKNGIDLHYLFGDPFYHHHIYNFNNLDKRMSRALMETMGNYVKDLIFAPTSRVREGRQWTYDNNKIYLHFVADNPTIQVHDNPVPRDVEFWENYLPELGERLI